MDCYRTKPTTIIAAAFVERNKAMFEILTEEQKQVFIEKMESAKKNFIKKYSPLDEDLIALVEQLFNTNHHTM